MFAVIVDAGSTSSKISVITWRDWPFRTNEWVEEINHTIVEPGISAYAEDPKEASDRLVPILKQTLEYNVPALEGSKTSLYLAATAGMRLLDLNNPLKSAEIMESLRQTLPNIGAVVHNVFSDIRIISGSTEGRYGWVAANYLDRKLGDPSGLSPESGDKMSGMLDLGGASLHPQKLLLHERISAITSWKVFCFLRFLLPNPFLQISDRRFKFNQKTSPAGRRHVLSKKLE
nr:unnamed protein product [Spirometra erinaceieuropaei]